MQQKKLFVFECTNTFIVICEYGDKIDFLLKHMNFEMLRLTLPYEILKYV